MAELTRSIRSDQTFEQADALVLRLQEGDEAAFNEVFQLYKDMVYTLALKLLANKADAMDVTQEVFLTLYRKIGSFRGDSSLKTWLYRIAINQAAGRNRWWRRRFWSRTTSLNLDPENGKDAGSAPLPSDDPSPARECFSAELREAMTQALGTLPYDQRVALTLRDLEGLSYEEIAEVMDAHLGTVKSRIARGREKLREILEAFRGGESL